MLEYALQVWQVIPYYLSDRIESVERWALKIIYPNSSCSQALSLANETTISNRRELLCHKFMAETTDTRDHPLSCLVSTAVQRTNPYNLRPGSSRRFNKFTRIERSENFLLLNNRRLSIRRDNLFKLFFKYCNYLYIALMQHYCYL